MKILLVWTHPNETSLVQLLAQEMEKDLIEQGHEVITLDLYRSNFNPVSKDYSSHDEEGEFFAHDHPVAQQHAKWIEEADGYVFVYPVWWWDRPAMLKGWFESLFRWGFAIDVTNRGYIPRLKGKRALVIQTCGSSEEELKKQGAIEVMHGAIGHGTLEFVGIQVDAIETFYSVSKTDEARLLQMKDRLLQVSQSWKGL